MKTLYFDMDGTLVNLYSDPNWLDKILAEDITLYQDAKPLIKPSQLRKTVKQLKQKGYRVGIISYLPWKTSKTYQLKVEKVKKEYLNSVFSNIEFDKIHIIPYGIPKDSFADKGDILFDDDIKVRKSWNKGKCYTHENILNKIKNIYLK